jgi:hypothetical protein
VHSALYHVRYVEGTTDARYVLNYVPWSSLVDPMCVHSTLGTFLVDSGIWALLKSSFSRVQGEIFSFLCFGSGSGISFTGIVGFVNHEPAGP